MQCNGWTRIGGAVVWFRSGHVVSVSRGTMSRGIVGTGQGLRDWDAQEHPGPRFNIIMIIYRLYTTAVTK